MIDVLSCHPLETPAMLTPHRSKAALAHENGIRPRFKGTPDFGILSPEKAFVISAISQIFMILNQILLM